MERSKDQPTGNGWVRRLRALREFANEPGGVALLVLAFALGVFTGWIPSPLTRIETTLAAHDATLRGAIDRRVGTDAKLAKILERLTLRECAEIRDADIRRRCLE